MKKFMCFVIMIVLLLSGTSGAFAKTTVNNVSPGISPLYVSVERHMERFSKELNGNGKMTVYVFPMTNSSLDKVVADIKVTKIGGNGAIYDEALNLEYNSTWGRFEGEDTCKLSSIGTYRMETEYRCYKGGKLIERIDGVTKLLSI